MSAQSDRLEVVIASDLALVLYKSDSRSAGTAGLFRNSAQQLVFTGFDLDRVRLVVRRSDCCLWFGRTCYEVPRESVDGIAEFLGVPVQDEQDSAS